jgi:hypothetical protein
MKINWKRSALRIWLVGTCLYVPVAALATYDDIRLRNYRLSQNLGDTIPFSEENLGEILAIAFIPPIGILVVGLRSFLFK